MSNTFKEIDAVEALKRLIKLAVSRGYSYAQIAEEEETKAHWNANSIKQFANRKAASRNNERIATLAELILEHFRHLGDIKREVKEDLIKIRESISDNGNNSIFHNIDQSFDDINSSASSLRLPDYFYFCRFKLTGEFIILIKIEIIESTTAMAFTMKIAGSNDQKRVVIGNVSKSITNTYFTGVAYNVLSQMSEREFSGVDFSKDYNIKKFLSENPIGQELIAISNYTLVNSEIPVCFSGLDGRGDPISGIGVLLSPEAARLHNVGHNTVSHIKRKSGDYSLNALMDKMNAQTLSLNKT